MLDYSSKGQGKVSMIPYIHNTMSTFPAATPAGGYFFHVQDLPLPTLIISKEQAIVFHHTMLNYYFFVLKQHESFLSQ